MLISHANSLFSELCGVLSFPPSNVYSSPLNRFFDSIVKVISCHGAVVKHAGSQSVVPNYHISLL